MVDRANVVQPQGGFFDLEKTQKDITSAYNKAERSQQIGVGRQTQATAKEFQQQVARYGGSAFDTGASQKVMADVFADMNAQIANIQNTYAIQKNQSLMSADQYFTNLASQGVIDSATGSFLKSTFNMQVELNEQNFRNQIKLLEKQGSMQESASMWGGLGTIAGMAIAGPLGKIGGNFLDNLFGGDN